MIVIITILTIIIFILTAFDNVDRTKEYLKYRIKRINLTYKSLWTEGDFLVRITQGGMIIITEIFNLLSIYNVVLKYVKLHFSIEVDVIFKTTIIISGVIIVHYLMGYILLLSSNLHRYMSMGIDKSIKGDFLLTYFIISSYVMILIVFPNELNKYTLSGALGIIISYFLNMKLLLKIMRNPRCIKFDRKDRGGFFQVFIAAMSIVTMIVINLFLGVSLTNIIDKGAFSSNPNNFDLFYYTIVTFTTIGFGDISPVSNLAKFMAIVISITSIICLTIFLGSIFSLRERRER